MAKITSLPKSVLALGRVKQKSTVGTRNIR